MSGVTGGKAGPCICFLASLLKRLSISAVLMSHESPMARSRSLALTPLPAVMFCSNPMSCSASKTCMCCASSYCSSWISNGIEVSAVGSSGSPHHDAPIVRTVVLPATRYGSHLRPLAKHVFGSPGWKPFVRMSQSSGKLMLRCQYALLRLVKL